MGGFNLGSALTGMGGGALAGFGSGGPLGAALGAGAGLFGGFGGGSQKEKLSKFDQFSPEQQQLLDQLLQMLSAEGELGQGYGDSLSALREMLDPSSASYERFAAPHMQQFNEQTIPNLAERFAGAGGGALSSSGFGQALSSAGSQLQTQLAGMKSGLQQQAMRDLMGQYNSMSGTALSAQPFGYMQKPGRESFGQSALSGFASKGFPGLGQGGNSLSNLWNNKGNV